MNRFTIVVDDKAVSVDGVGHADLEFAIDPAIHAVQWYGNFGEVEYSPVYNPETGEVTKAPNRIITDYAEFQPALDAFAAWVPPPPIEITPAPAESQPQTTGTQTL